MSLLYPSIRGIWSCACAAACGVSGELVLLCTTIRTRPVARTYVALDDFHHEAGHFLCVERLLQGCNLVHAASKAPNVRA